MASNDGKKAAMGCGSLIAGVLFLGLIIFLVMGPAGIKNQFTAWRANAYGSNWLVIQYTGMGEVQNHWELKSAAIHNEGQSDGIYFSTDHGVVHLSGHYMYIQDPTPEAKEQYLKKAPAALKK